MLRNPHSDATASGDSSSGKTNASGFFTTTKDNLLRILLCLCLISTFFSVIYPLVFVVTSLAITFHTKRLLRAQWLGWIALYAAYALLTYARDPSLAEGSTLNVIKLLVNFCFLAQAVSWASGTRGGETSAYLERTLVIILIAMLFQLFVYHLTTGFAYIQPVSSSAVGDSLYLPSHQFFGPADKNIFGAKLAIFGFLAILARWIRTEEVPFLLIAIVSTGAYFSASRTPMIALAVGVMAIILAQHGKVLQKVLAVVCALAALPFALVKLVRIDNFDQMSDGFAIRLIYWAAFFQNLRFISFWGNGFLSAKQFLQHYAVFYNGEPQMHNVFINNYLDFGAVGSLAFVFFLTTYLSFCNTHYPSWRYWGVCAAPLLGVMLTLYAGYESDFVVYLFSIFVLAQGIAGKKPFTRAKPLSMPRRSHWLKAIS